jgi:hypothetical protein
MMDQFLFLTRGICGSFLCSEVAYCELSAGEVEVLAAFSSV